MAVETATFYCRTQEARKIIVIDYGFLGDSVHLIPALWEIKRHYPKAQLHTLSANVGSEVLKLVPCVDRAWGFPLTEKSPSFWKHWDILAGIRREDFDVAFNFSGSDRSIFTTRLTGARWRLAYQAGRRHFWNRLFIPEWVGRQSREIPVYEQRRQVLAACGMTLEPARFDLHVPELAKTWALAQVPEGAVHFSINASSAIKEWPLEHWITLARQMLAANPHRVIVATASAKSRELERLRALSAGVNDSRLICFEALNLGQLVALLQRCRLHVGADSGVLHLALASGVATFSLFRHYEGMKEWMPVGEKHAACIARCGCVAGQVRDCEQLGVSECLREILPDQVLVEISRKLLA